MYSVSEACAEAIRLGKATFTISGVATLSDNTTVAINDSNINNGSVEITYKCVEGDELTFGGGFLGELTMSLRANMSRYLFYGAKLVLTTTAHYKDDGELKTEDIALGVWNVAEAKRAKNSLQITAYDNLITFDVPFNVEVTGNAYELISSFCNEYDLEMAEDVDYYKALPNGEEHHTFNQDSGCSTVRQMLTATAQACGCLLIADREGRISCRQYGEEPCVELDYAHRYNATIADYDCNYIALQITGLGGTYETISNDEDAQGLVMKITDAPAWDVGVAETFQRMCNQLFEYVETIEYTPCEFSTFCNPLIEVGDRIAIIKDTDNSTVETLVMDIVWSYRSATDYTSVGSNKYLIGITGAGEERTLRQIQTEIERQKIVFNVFRNAGDIHASPTLWQDLGTCTFVAAENTQGVFNGTFDIVANKDDIDNEQTFTVYDADGEPHEITVHDTKLATTKLYVRYLFNEIQYGEEYEADLTTGAHIITLSQPITSISKDIVNRLQVQIKLDDEETGEAYVPDLKFIGSISAQGLADTIDWDGTITIAERAEPYDLPEFLEISLIPVTSQAVITFNDDHEYITPADTASIIDIVHSISIVPCFDEVTISPIIVAVSRSYSFPNEWIYDAQDIVFGVPNIQIRTEHTYEAEIGSIDRGSIKAVEIPFSNFGTLVDLEVE